MNDLAIMAKAVRTVEPIARSVTTSASSGIASTSGIQS